MLHARIAARAFNTPLLVEPSKAMAFLSGLGPRVLRRRIELADDAAQTDRVSHPLPARASILRDLRRSDPSRRLDRAVLGANQL
jgi:hypothetical protein